MENIFEIDKNLAQSTGTPIIKDGQAILMYDIRKKPFEIFGLYDAENSEPFIRLPRSVAEATSQRVAGLAYHTAGGRVRFSTNSEKIVLSVKLNAWSPMPHMTPTGIYGFDIFVDNEKGSTFAGIFGPPTDGTLEYEREINFESRKEREITINFPLYNAVKSVSVGLLEGTTLGFHSPYKIQKPILYYGSSITQGGCASRPSMSYESIISRRLDANYINLGFSGSAKGEDAIVDYMATLDISAFVCDYDHNAPNPEHLKKTHYKLYEKMRKAKPDLPIILVTAPRNNYDKYDFVLRRAIIMETYVKGIKSGDKNLYFVDGEAFYMGLEPFEATVDKTHPTDLGFSAMARNIGSVLEKILKG